MIPGINVSHRQREIDWGAVKRSGVQFAFIKATEFEDKKTVLKIDERLGINMQGTAEHGIHWSAYHYFRTHMDPIIQAKLFCETIGDFTSLPPVLNLEVAGARGERLNYKVRQFLAEVEKQTGRRPIIFTNDGFWRSYMCCEKESHADWAREYPLWSAQYTSLWPTATYPWAGWDFWQYTDKGKIPGIPTPVDMNWFNGSERDLIDRFVGVVQPETQPEWIADARVENISSDGQAKSYAASDDSVEYRGDFQEPDRQHRHIHSPRSEMRPTHSKVLTENGDGSREEDWIRAYFLQPA